MPYCTAALTPVPCIKLGPDPSPMCWIAPEPFTWDCVHKPDYPGLCHQAWRARKFGDGGVVAVLITTTYLLPNFRTHSEPHELDDMALWAGYGPQAGVWPPLTKKDANGKQFLFIFIWFSFPQEFRFISKWTKLPSSEFLKQLTQVGR